MNTIDTHNLICNFGRHSGERWTRIPPGYLLRVVNNMANKPQIQAIAEAELERRGTQFPEIELSIHAIDRASERYLHLYVQDCQEQKAGFYSWLLGRAERALKSEEGAAAYGDGGKVTHDGMTFVFEIPGSWPILKTVM